MTVLTFRGRKKRIATGRSNLQLGLKLSEFYALLTLRNSVALNMNRTGEERKEVRLQKIT